MNLFCTAKIAILSVEFAGRLALPCMTSVLAPPDQLSKIATLSAIIARFRDRRSVRSYG